MGWVKRNTLMPHPPGSTRYTGTAIGSALTSAAGAGNRKTAQIGKVHWVGGSPGGAEGLTIRNCRKVWYLTGAVTADATATIRTSIQGKTAGARTPDGVILDAQGGTANAYLDTLIPAANSWIEVDLTAANMPTLSEGQTVAIVHEIVNTGDGTASVVINGTSMTGQNGEALTTGYSNPTWTAVTAGIPNIMIQATDGTYGWISNEEYIPGQSYTTDVYNSGTAITKIAGVYTADADIKISGAKLALTSNVSAGTFNVVLRDMDGAQIGNNIQTFEGAELTTANIYFRLVDGPYLLRRGASIMVSLEPTSVTDMTIGTITYPNATLQAEASMGVNVGLRYYTSGAWGDVDTLSRPAWGLIIAEEFIPSKGKGMSKMDLVNPLTSVDFPTETASFADTAGSTDPWVAGPEGVLVWADQDCYVAVGEGAVATANHTPIPAYTPVPFKVPQSTGAAWRVSALQMSVAGTVYAKPINAK